MLGFARVVAQAGLAIDSVAGQDELWIDSVAEPVGPVIGSAEEPNVLCFGRAVVLTWPRVGEMKRIEPEVAWLAWPEPLRATT